MPCAVLAIFSRSAIVPADRLGLTPCLVLKSRTSGTDIMLETQDPNFSDFLSSRAQLTVGSSSVDKFLSAVRRHLGMDIAFVSQFRATDRVFRHVDAQVPSPIHVGDAISL